MRESSVIRLALLWPKHFSIMLISLFVNETGETKITKCFWAGKGQYTNILYFS